MKKISYYCVRGLLALTVMVMVLLPAPALAENPTLVGDPLIQAMIDQVNSEYLYNQVGSLSGEWPVLVGGSMYTFTTRNSYNALNLIAAQYIYERFEEMGFSPSYHQFPFSATTRKNIIAEQPGLTYPSQILLVTGHMDSVSYGGNAPGADDNASGTVGVLMAAEILRQYKFDYTIRYVLFSGEEQGLIGSSYYAAYVYGQGQNIIGVLNMDMIGYNTIGSSPGIDLDVRTVNDDPGNADLVLANAFVDVINTYQINLVPQILRNSVQYSDHASFWNYGYPAMLAIEDDGDFTPYYHQSTDRLSTLDMTYFTNFAKAAVGTVATLAQPIYGQLSGTVTNAFNGTPLNWVQIRASEGGAYNWLASTDANGEYSLALPSGTYVITATLNGYFPFITENVIIMDGETTTLDIALTPPDATYTLSGAVTEAYYGNPITATVSFPGTDFPDLQTDGATGAYAAILPGGTYTVTVSADGYGPQARIVELNSNQVADFVLQPVCLLVVDGDPDDLEGYYTSSLDQLGKAYDVTATAPSLSTLAGYQGVIWLTGNAISSTLTITDQLNLSSYLDGGGRLFISGQGIGNDLAGSDFLESYLHAAFEREPAETFALTGLDYLSGTLVTISGGDGAGNQTHPDAVLPLAGGVALFDYPEPEAYAAVAYSGVYSTTFFAFGFEAINSQADRDQVMGDVLEYLAVCQTPQAPQASFEHTLPAEVGLPVTFTNTSRGTPWMEYEWDFGDGITTTLANPVHTYAVIGTYTVTLTVTNPWGADTAETAITVVEVEVPPVPEFTIFLPVILRSEATP